MNHPLSVGTNVGVIVEDNRGIEGCIASEPEFEDEFDSYLAAEESLENYRANEFEKKEFSYRVVSTSRWK